MSWKRWGSRMKRFSQLAWPYMIWVNDKSFGGSLDLKWNICKYLSYNLRAGGNVNINERARWYGMQLTMGEA